MTTDPRLAPVTWTAAAPPTRLQRRAALLSAAALLWGLWYFSWLLRPDRVGNPFLFAVLVVAELFNFGQAVGFWLTCVRRPARRRRGHRRIGHLVDVDVFIPVYNEPVEVVEATVDAARRMRGARVHVALLDDGDSPAMRAMARRLGIRYVQRAEHSGAKAGNINHALTVTDAAFVAVFDCDHVPDAAFLEETLGHFRDDRVAFVQTPQYYANHERGGVTQAAWAQQALFFGAIARGKATVIVDVLLWHQRRVPSRTARARRRIPGRLADRRLPTQLPAARDRLALGVRPEGPRPRTRPRGPRLLRQPAAPLGPGMPVEHPVHHPRANFPAGKRRSTCCQRSTSSPVGPCWCTSRCPSSGSPPGANRSPAPPPTSSSSTSGRTSRCRSPRWPPSARDLHVRRLLPRLLDVLDPHPRHAPRVAATPRKLRRHTKARPARHPTASRRSQPDRRRRTRRRRDPRPHPRPVPRHPQQRRLRRRSRHRPHPRHPRRR